jgi:hypothetical protein
MEGERNTTTQYRQSGESQELPPADQVEVKERGLLDTLLGRKKAPAEDQENQEEALVSAMENVNVSEPETKHEGGGEKKESLLAKLHRTGSGSSSVNPDNICSRFSRIFHISHYVTLILMTLIARVYSRATRKRR